MKNRLLKYAFVAAGALAPVAAMAEGEDLATQLSTAATGAITAAVTVVGAVLVAGIAIPVAKKTYSLIKSALGRA